MDNVLEGHSYMTKSEPPRRLQTGQHWLSWLVMSAGYLTAARRCDTGSMATANSGEEIDTEALRRVLQQNPMALLTDLVVPASLYAFAAEQAMKALAIRARTDRRCLGTHDLALLWHDLPTGYQKGIAQVATLASKKSVGRTDLERMIEDHRHTFDRWRYILETGQRPHGLHLASLKLVAIGAFDYGQILVTSEEPLNSAVE